MKGGGGVGVVGCECVGVAVEGGYNDCLLLSENSSVPRGDASAWIPRLTSRVLRLI